MTTQNTTTAGARTRTTKVINPMAEYHGEYPYGHFSLSWNDPDGNRYHIWMEYRPNGTEPYKPQDDKLYKNPPLNADGECKKHDEPGYFSTIHLRISAKANQKLVNEALDRVDFEVAAAAAKNKAARDQAQREKEARERAARKRLDEAAPALLKAARRAAAHIGLNLQTGFDPKINGPAAKEIFEQINAAIAKAELTEVETTA